MFIFILLTALSCKEIKYHVRKHFTIIDPIHDIHQVEYRVEMKFGSTQQPLELIIDTGSSDLWVPDKKAKGFLPGSSNISKLVQSFDCHASTTCKNTHDSYSLLYDDGPIQGTLAWDQVWMNDIKFNQSFLLINRAEGNMASSGGILGLGFHSIAANPYPSILDSLEKQKLIDKKYFSLYLRDEGQLGSYILFGGIDMQYARKGEHMAYVPLISDYAYLISIEGMAIGDTLFEIPTALVDSGTSCLTVPAEAMDNMVQQFASLGVQCSYRVENYAPAYCTVHCIVDATHEQGIIDALPIIKIRVNSSVELILNPQDYIYSCVILNGSQSKCNTKLERSQQDDFLLLGDAFLHSYYTVFDQSEKRLGFVHSINNRGLKIRVKDRHLANWGARLMCILILLFMQ